MADESKLVKRWDPTRFARSGSFMTHANPENDPVLQAMKNVFQRMSESAKEASSEEVSSSSQKTKDSNSLDGNADAERDEAAAEASSHREAFKDESRRLVPNRGPRSG